MSGGPRAPVPDFSWDEHVQRLSEAQFKLRYRLSFLSFNKLLAILAPSLAVNNEKQACNCRSGKPVELPTRLATALRYFAGGDPQDLMLIYGMSKTMVMRCVWRVVDAIHKHLDNMHFPIDDVEKLKVLEAEFSAASARRERVLMMLRSSRCSRRSSAQPVLAVRESGFKRIIDPNLHRTKKRPRGRQAE